MQITSHSLLDWVVAPLTLVVGYFAKLALANDKRLAVMEERFNAVEKRLGEIKEDVQFIRQRWERWQ